MGAGLVNIAGGDPGWVVEVLRASPVWNAIAGAWRAGAALAGSSAGAMALCEWCLVQTNWPGEVEERSVGPGAVTILQGSRRNRHIEGEKIDGMSNPEP